MPNCFQLTRIGASEPSALNAIDEELCAYLNVPVDEHWYVARWYDIIGFRLALGIPLDSAEMLDAVTFNPTLVTILAYLRDHFTADAWAER